jgi:NADH-quinone oxidoreductase subunit F
MVQILARLERGDADATDIDTLLDACDNILGRSFCALADGAVSPITSSVQYFKDEYVAHWENGGCPFDEAAATLFAPAGASS